WWAGLAGSASLEQRRELAVAAELLVEPLQRRAGNRLARPALQHALVGMNGLVCAVDPVGAQIAQLEEGRALACGLRRADGRALALEPDAQGAPALGRAQDPQQILLARLVGAGLLRDDQHPDRGVGVAQLMLVELCELGRALGLVDVGGRRFEL